MNSLMDIDLQRQRLAKIEGCASEPRRCQGSTLDGAVICTINLDLDFPGVKIKIKPATDPYIHDDLTS
jgi:hypothetical protein